MRDSVGTVACFLPQAAAVAFLSYFLPVLEWA